MRLEFPMWLVAWDRYALMASMTNQMTYAQAMAHKCVVTEVCPQAFLECITQSFTNLCEVACLAVQEGRRSLMGVLYDEIARYRFTFVTVFVAHHQLHSGQERLGRQSFQVGLSLQVQLVTVVTFAFELFSELRFAIKVE